MITPDDAGHDGVTVTRSEERLRTEVVARPVQRAILRKVIVEEQRTVQVTVRREEFRLSYEPAGEDDAVDLAATEPLEMVLHEERLEIVKTVVPVERVRIAVRRVTEERAVTEDVRSERIEIDGEILPTGDETTTGRHRG